MSKIVCENHGVDIVMHYKDRGCPLCKARDREQALLQLLVDRDVLPIVPEHHSWVILDVWSRLDPIDRIVPDLRTIGHDDVKRI